MENIFPIMIVEGAQKCVFTRHVAITQYWAILLKFHLTAGLFVVDNLLCVLLAAGLVLYQI